MTKVHGQSNTLGMLSNLFLNFGVATEEHVGTVEFFFGAGQFLQEGNSTIHILNPSRSTRWICTCHALSLRLSFTQFMHMSNFIRLVLGNPSFATEILNVMTHQNTRHKFKQLRTVASVQHDHRALQLDFVVRNVLMKVNQRRSSGPTPDEHHARQFGRRFFQIVEQCVVWSITIQ